MWHFNRRPKRVSEQTMKLFGERTFQAQRRADASNLVMRSWHDKLKGQ